MGREKLRYEIALLVVALALLLTSLAWPQIPSQASPSADATVQRAWQRAQEIGVYNFTTEIAYNSCRNRHCPKCQGAKQEQWVQARIQDLLPVPYHHVVFTLPDEPLHTLMLYNKGVMYDLFFQSAAETLHTFARDPEHLGAEIGFTGVLHTWGQTLCYHPHRCPWWAIYVARNTATLPRKQRMASAVVAR
jgi:hypothetical protein